MSSDLLGTQDSFKIAGSALTRATNVAPNDLVLGSDTVMCGELSDVLPVFGHTVPDVIDHPTRLSYETIMCGQRINWHLALGTQRFAKILKRVYRAIHDDVNDIVSHSYFPHLLESRRVLTKLQPAFVDKESIQARLHEHADAFLETFRPDSSGMTQSVRYSHDTTTGRLTVKSGPKVLNLGRSHRSVLTSRFKKGAIGIIDFVSLEPRTALLLTRPETPFDIYEEMRKELGSQHTRAQLKVATISALYGQRGETSIPQSVISRFFGLPEIHRRHLVGETYGNLYGRPLSSGDERLRLPHFVQSTAVDVALKGFGKLCDTYREMVPLFVIHDAIVVDAERDLLQSLGKTGIEIDIEPLGKFFLTVKMIDEDNS